MAKSKAVAEEKVTVEEQPVEEKELTKKELKEQQKLEKQKLKEQQKLDKQKQREKEERKNKKNKKPGLFRRIKDSWGELKKVTWPTFASVCKKTGVVILVVLIFTIVLFGIDFGLGALYRLFASKF